MDQKSTNQNYCLIEGHDNKGYIAVCISSSCTNNQKLICSKCILEGRHKSHEQEIIYIKDYVDYQSQEIFDIPLWKKEGEHIFNQVCDWVIDLNQIEREERIEALFSAFRKNINTLIDEAEKKYKERLGRDSEILMELTEKFMKVNPINIISDKFRELNENKLNPSDFEKFLQNSIIDSEERKLQIEELEETFNEIRQIEESLNFKNLSNQLTKELPQFLRADSSLDIGSPTSSMVKQSSAVYKEQLHKKDSVDSDSQGLPSLTKQASSACKREKKKILLLGKSNIGKSTLLNTLIHREYQSDISAHIQRNMVYVYDLQVGIKKYLLTIQEVSGDEQITSENKKLFKDVDAAVLLYDSNESFDELDRWVNLFIEFGLTADQHVKFPFILTKIIKNEEELPISSDKINQFVQEHVISSQEVVDTTSLKSINSFLENVITEL